MRRLIVVALVLAACSSSNGSTESETSSTTTPPPPESTTTTTTTAPALAISSPAFEDGAEIPVAHTCDGADLSPALSIEGLPDDTESLVIIVDDPDAPTGTWDHWVEFDIPAGSGSLDIAEGTGPIGVEGVNSWNLPGYMGPCPPEGEEHEYFFEVYALSEMLGLDEGVGSSQVYSAMEGSIISSAELTGTYGR